MMNIIKRCLSGKIRCQLKLLIIPIIFFVGLIPQWRSQDVIIMQSTDYETTNFIDTDHTAHHEISSFGDKFQYCSRNCVSDMKDNQTFANCPKSVTQLNMEIDHRIDTLTVTPLQTLDNFNSPCWYERLDSITPYSPEEHPFSRLFKAQGVEAFNSFNKAFSTFNTLHETRCDQGVGGWRIRCMPSFYTVGVIKSGTTALYTQLIKNSPFVKGPAFKEPNYWNFVRYEVLGSGYFLIEKHLKKIKDVPFPRSLGLYMDLFDMSAEFARTTVTRDSNGMLHHPTMIGDASALYLTEFDAWEKLTGNIGLTEPRYILAHFIHRLTPQAKIIVILRNPVDRLYSQYKYWKQKKGKSPEAFDSLVRKALGLMEDCLQTRTLRSCVYDTNISHSTPPVSLMSSMYHPFINDWISVFGKNQILVIHMESFYQNVTGSTQDVLRFLGVDTGEEIVDYGIQNINEKSVAPMLNTTRMLLSKFFSPYNRQLSEMLHDERFLWK